MVERKRRSTYEETGESGLAWHIVEEAVYHEIEWLRKVIPQKLGPAETPGCDECIYTYRKIALLIVTGTIHAREFMARRGHDLWDDLTRTEAIDSIAHHGGEWHRKMMSVLTTYFMKQGFEVIPEPFLSKGRADLGIYKKGYKDLFVEIGTTSVYKLWWNLQASMNCLILLVPEENYAIEFTCRSDRNDVLRKATEAI